MEDFNFEIDILAREIEKKKEAFASAQKNSFQQVYMADQGLIRHVPWSHLFKQYIALSEKYPNNDQIDLVDLIDKLAPETLWANKYCLHQLYGPAIDFSINLQHYANERRLDAKFYQKQGFMFHSVSKGLHAAYLENFAIPNHADIAIETNNSEAALVLPDTLLRIPSDTRLKQKQRTYAIKLIQKGEEPYKYLQRQNKLIKSFQLGAKTK